LISGHANLIHGERPDDWIEKIEKCKKKAAALGCAAGGNLADHAVLRRALPFRHAHGKNLLDQFGVHSCEHAQRFDGIGGATIAEKLA
jgi:hypothetical protein